MSEKKVLVIATGGTIGSASSNAGISPNSSTMNKIVELALPGLYKQGFRTSVYVKRLMNKDSTNMSAENQATIAKEVFKATLRDYDGVVITHGTNTLHFTSSMLSLMLRDIDKPIVLTGAMRTLEQPESDAVDNLKAAIMFAIEGPKGIYVAFNNKLMRGCTIFESRLSNIDGFRSMEEPVAMIKDGRVVYSVKREEQLLLNKPSIDLRYNTNVTVYLFPGISYTTMKVSEKDSNGIVLVGYASMGIPDYITKQVQEIASRIPVVLTSILPNLVTKVGDYEVSRRMVSSGVIIGTGFFPFDLSNLVFTLGHFNKGKIKVKKVKEMFDRNIAEVLRR